jgi:hypothetical protein
MQMQNMKRKISGGWGWGWGLDLFFFFRLSRGARRALRELRLVVEGGFVGVSFSCRPGVGSSVAISGAMSKGVSEVELAVAQFLSGVLEKATLTENLRVGVRLHLAKKKQTQSIDHGDPASQERFAGTGPASPTGFAGTGTGKNGNCKDDEAGAPLASFTELGITLEEAFEKYRRYLN